MLGSSAFFCRLVNIVEAWVFPVLVLGLALAAFTWNADAVFFKGSVYFTDGDCYARMTRVRLLQEHPLAPIRQHNFENYPAGTRPHTTAPLDYLIAGLAGVLGVFFSEALPLAGAWISPLLGLAMLGFLAVWGRGVAFGGAPIILLAVSPIISHGFLLGRPDHQSLLMLLMAIALAAEADMWAGTTKGSLVREQELVDEKAAEPCVPPGGVELLSAVAWALALWVSLFEPLVLLTAVLLLRFVARRLIFARTPMVVFFAILLVGFLVNGFPAAAFDAHFAGWSRNIGELGHGSLPVLFSWAGWLAPLAPFALLAGYFRKREPVYLLLCALTALLAGLTFLHLRWGYFFAISLAVSLPWLLPLARWKIAGWGIFLISLWPVAACWESTLYPDVAASRARAESVVDAVELRDAAIQLKGLPTHGVLAPWWFSPAIVWWSGQNCVAGSSHQSLPGIADTAEFFLSEGSGREILERRQAGYIVAYEPDRLISNSAQILGRPPPPNPLAKRLYEHPRQADYPLLYANRFFRVFEYPQPEKNDGAKKKDDPTRNGGNASPTGERLPRRGPSALEFRHLRTFDEEVPTEGKEPIRR